MIRQDSGQSITGGRCLSLKAIKHSLCEFDKFYWAIIEKTSKRKYTVGGGAKMTKHLSIALCKYKSLFCVVEDIWWLCARCSGVQQPWEYQQNQAQEGQCQG